MPITTVPPVLYKYLAPDRALQVLKDLRIRFSQVSVLDDVDEFQPFYKDFATREETEEIAREFLLNDLEFAYAPVCDQVRDLRMFVTDRRAPSAYKV